MILKVAHVYVRGRRSLELMDLFQEGYLGLIRAIELYEPTREAQLSTYANYWIKQAIRRAIENGDHFIRKPSHLWKADWEGSDAVWSRPLNLDRLDEDSLTTRLLPGDREPEPDQAALDRERRLIILRAVRQFQGRNRSILLHRRELLRGRTRVTLDDLGAQLGVTRERIRQIQMKAERKLAVRLSSYAYCFFNVTSLSTANCSEPEAGDDQLDEDEEFEA